MKTFFELSENVKSADKKPEQFTKPDGKKGTRMVPVDKEVIKQEKTLEWLKAALAKEAKKVKPRQDDMEEAYEQTMYCKKCGCERGDPDPNCTCEMNNAELTDAQCYSEQSKCGSRPKKEGVKEAEIPHGKTIFTKKPEPSKKDQKTIKKIQDLMRNANKIGNTSYRGKKEDVSEISKGMASRYIKKSQVSTADAAKSVERGNIDSKSPDRDIAKAGKAQAKKGIKTFINRNKGTSTAVDKLTGKAKVPAKEGMAQGIVKQKISREKEMDAKRHDRMMDRARMKDTKKKNMSELSMSMKDLTKTGLNKHASPDKNKIRKGLDALKKAGNAKADAEAGERRKKFSELSNNKMGQYVRKAADDAAKKGAAGDTKKAQARVKGVSKAMDKMDTNRLFGRQ